MSVSGSRRSGRCGHWSPAAAHVPLIVWCPDCNHQVEPDPAEIAARAEIGVIDWRGRLVCPPARQPAYRYGCDRDEAAPRVGEPPTPPFVNHSAGVVTPMTPSAVIVPRQRLWRDEAGSGRGELANARLALPSVLSPRVANRLPLDI